MKGRFTCVGIGPGDPRLMTFLAADTIRACDVAALPKSGARDNAALAIAAELLKDKPLLYCDMPMTRDKARLAACHEAAAKQVAALLDEGKNVAFLTLGDPAVYSTPMYLHHILKGWGYETAMVPGVPSFCAAAAALDTSLCEGGQMLHIIPASYPDVEHALDADGNKVLMKSGKSIRAVADRLSGQGKEAMAVERCGMEGERIHRTLDTIPDDASYFSIVLVKDKEENAN